MIVSMGIERTTDAVPEPPWWRSSGRRSAPRPRLTREAIVEAALGVLDLEGLDALSMRRVAEELGTGAASLYWHVGGKEELLELVFDRVLGEATFPQPDPGRWQEQIKEATREMRRVAMSHRDFARLQLNRFPSGPNGIKMAERLLAILRASGLSDRTCAYVVPLLPLYANAFVLEEAPQSPSSSAGEKLPEETLGAIRGYLESLPAERYPNLVALSGDLASPAQEERFDLGLEVLVRGIAALPG